MFALDANTAADFAVALLIHYSFDLGGYKATELIDFWLKDYPAIWVCQGVIEALYQGRYKAISVEQILAFWNRRGQAIYHYNYEFERLVCSKFPQPMAGQPHTTHASPPVPVAVTFSNGDDDPAIVKVESGVGEKTPAQLLDPTANVPPATNQIDEKPAQKNSAQTNDNGQQARSSKSDQHRPIEQFTPADDGSDFYTKLKILAQHSQKEAGE